MKVGRDLCAQQLEFLEGEVTCKFSTDKTISFPFYLNPTLQIAESFLLWIRQVRNLTSQINKDKWWHKQFFMSNSMNGRLGEAELRFLSLLFLFFQATFRWTQDGSLKLLRTSDHKKAKINNLSLLWKVFKHCAFLYELCRNRLITTWNEKRSFCWKSCANEFSSKHREPEKTRNKVP